VYELQGDLLFAGAEAVVRELSGVAPEADAIVLDVNRVNEIADVARRLLQDSRARLDRYGCAVALVDADRALPRVEEAGSPVFTDQDEAIAWAEDLVIERAGVERASAARIDPAAHALLDDLAPDEQEVLRELLERRTAPAGETLVAGGDAAEGIFLVVSGEASASVADGERGEPRRVAVLPAGTSFGKRSAIAGEPHTTDVVADTPMELLVLTPDGLRELERRAPRVAIALLRTMFSHAHASAERGAVEDATD
jgi:glutaminase